jgi:catechol 2,3-dioxygenase-like lactoylglutathione lyase family enzyme
MIHHITREIPPSQLPACVSFYALLGFQAVPAPPGIAARAVWLERSQEGVRTQVHLMPAEGAEPASGHFGVVCPDYERTCQELRQAGHEPEPRAQHWGSPRAYVRDPFGNLVEIMAWPPGQPPGGED